MKLAQASIIAAAGLTLAACGSTARPAGHASSHPAPSPATRTSSPSPNSPAPVATRAAGDVTGNWSGTCSFTLVSGGSLSFSTMNLASDGSIEWDSNAGTGGTWATLDVKPTSSGKEHNELALYPSDSNDSNRFTYLAADNRLTLTYIGNGNPAGIVTVIDGQFKLGASSGGIAAGPSTGNGERCTLTAAN